MLMQINLTKSVLDALKLHSHMIVNNCCVAIYIVHTQNNYFT